MEVPEWRLHSKVHRVYSIIGLNEKKKSFRDILEKFLEVSFTVSSATLTGNYPGDRVP